MFNIFGGNNVKEAIGIDIGTTSIKVVQVKKEKERLLLQTYGEVELGPYAGLEAGQATNLGEEKLTEAIQDLLKEAKVTSKEANFSIDPVSSFISMISVPGVDDSSLKTMIPLEARKYIPIPISEVQLDWWRVPNLLYDDGADKKNINIIIAAVKNERLYMYDRIVNKLGFLNVDYEIEGFSLVRSLGIAPNSGLVVIVDIGGSFTTVSLASSGIIVDMHVISHGSQEATIQLSRALSVSVKVAEESKREFGYKGDQSNSYFKEVMELSSYPLFGEVARLLLMYERKYNQSISGVVVTGGGARIEGISEMYKKTVQGDMKIATPFDQVNVPPFLQDMIHKIGPSYSVAVGLALKKLLS